jgi:hypothetical protein
MKLTDKDIMPLGKYKGMKMEEVPASYLLDHEDSFALKLSRNAKKIHQYILENRDVLLLEIDRQVQTPLEIDESIDFDINDLMN